MFSENLKPGEGTRVDEMRKLDGKKGSGVDMPADGKDVGDDMNKLTQVESVDVRREQQENFNKNKTEGEKKVAEALKKDPEGEAAHNNPESEKRVASELENNMSFV